jgi:predicted nucleic acid-binding protein
MSVADGEADVNRLKMIFTFLRDERAIYENWQQLVVDFSVLGKPAHDARLVAAMQRHHLTHILTFNKSDFVRYSHLVAMTPADVLSGVI